MAGSTPMKHALYKDIENAEMLRAYVRLGSVRAVHEEHFSHYSISTVYKRIRKALDKERSLNAEQHRKTADIHLDKLMRRALEHVESEDASVSLSGIAAALRTMERRAKLHGLDAETKVQVSGEVVSVSDETMIRVEQAQARLKALTAKEGPKPLRVVEES